MLATVFGMLSNELNGRLANSDAACLRSTKRDLIAIIRKHVLVCK